MRFLSIPNYVTRVHVVIDDWIEMPLVRKFAPPVAGIFLVALFVFLAFWQMDRAAEKKALLTLFDTDAPYAEIVNFESLTEFDRVQVYGQFHGDRQILIDNIVFNSRLGYYVITPFTTGADSDFLLVNRGWIAKDPTTSGAPDIGIDQRRRTIRGLAGGLPGVGIRAGEAFEGSSDWPRIAVYPSLDDVARELDAAVLPTVLLMSPDEDGGFARQWQPSVRGPMMHYGYAFQWFAMAAAVLAIMFWHLRTKRQSGDTTKH
jgi:surfeit locus 1 family protein